MISHTGLVLADVLAAGPHQKRGLHDFADDEKKADEDLDIREVGRDVPMPWETAGRRWHTKDRVGRRGEACCWDGRILARVVDRIHELGRFSDTNWNSRTIVEIAARKKTEGWFMHAITGEAWLLKLKFRVAKRTFDRDRLVETLRLAPLNEMPDLPVYGTEPRVRCKNLRGPWQEVQLAVHSLNEVDNDRFWKFLEEAVAGFRRFTERARQKPEDVMPWKVLGQKWHLARKGFPPGKKPAWDVEVLEELCEMLGEAAPAGQFLWNNQVLVHLFVKGHRPPWASLYTKRLGSLDLTLSGPKGHFTLGRVSNLGHAPEFDAGGEEVDLIKLHFRTIGDLHRGKLAEFLAEHVAATCGASIP